MVTTINVSHYCYNIDLYVNGAKLLPVSQTKTKSVYEYETQEPGRLNLRVCQNDNGKSRLNNLFYYYSFGYEFGTLYFWPLNIYCQYSAEIKAGTKVDLCVSKNMEKPESFIQEGNYIIENVSEQKAKNEKRNCLIPRNKRISFYVRSLICQITSNSLLLIAAALLMLGFSDGNGVGILFEDFSVFESIFFVILLIYQAVRIGIYVFIHTKKLIKDDGTYYEKAKSTLNKNKKR